MDHILTPLDKISLRLFARAEKFGDCWLWRGAQKRNGYGRISWGGKHWHVHRVSWIVHNGPIPRGLCVLHKCDVRHCINPDHLFLGTYRDNALDMYAKGRGGIRNLPRGSANHAAKLTEEDAREILAMKPLCRQYGQGQHLKLAKQYGVSFKHIYRIWKGQVWAHLQQAS